MPRPRAKVVERVARRVEGWLDGGLGRSWVLAVSGGGDSVALLRILHALAPRLELSLAVAHLDHGARGEQARADAAFVAELADRLGLPLELGDWSPARPSHFEADARRARLAWLLATAQARGATVVATGHTRDDQAETVLHRIVRGTGPRGLAGIPARRALGPDVTLVRPLLALGRDELRTYLADVGQSFREDATNCHLARTRARIRHYLLPRLAAAFNPRVVEALTRLAGQAAAANRLSDERARDVEARAVETTATEPGTLGIRRDILLAEPRMLRVEVLRRAWRHAGWPEGAMSARRWRRLERLLHADSIPRTDIGAGVSAVGDPARLILRRASAPLVPPPPMEPRPLPIPGMVEWRSGRILATLGPDPHADPDEAIDLDQIEPPLLVREPRPGDRFQPLGMPGESQRLSDFLRARGVPREARSAIPLVCDAQGIVWVVGHRIADRVKRTESTRRTLELRLGWR